jgi:hypothetical protein
MNTNEKHKSLLVIVVGLLILSYIFRNSTIINAKYLILAATIIGTVSLMFGIIGDWIVKGWFKLAEILGFINSKILLTAIFGLFLTPFALLFRLFNKNPLQLKPESKDSIYIERNHTYTPEDFEQVW